LPSTGASAPDEKATGCAGEGVELSAVVVNGMALGNIVESDYVLVRPG
jgi:hypothetical protein